MSEEAITLFFRENGSDKVYQASVEKEGSGFVVSYAYGRRGSTLTSGKKTQAPVSLEQARKIWQGLVNEKTKKGYTPSESGVPYRATTQENESSGISCQLLNPIEESEVASFIDDPKYYCQEKWDGRRCLLQKTNGTVKGINRRGLYVGIPETIESAARQIPTDMMIDGEAVGNDFHAFDILSLDGEDLRSRSYDDRLAILEGLLMVVNSRHLTCVETARASAEKEQLLNELRAENKEGIVFKDRTAKYVPGRPSSGGVARKLKFYAACTAIVAAINKKRSVQLAVYENGALVNVGNCSLRPSESAPEVGATVEIKYLYAFPNGGSLFQPTYLGVRDDVAASECTLSQLKFKTPDDEEEN